MNKQIHRRLCFSLYNYFLLVVTVGSHITNYCVYEVSLFFYVLVEAHVTAHVSIDLSIQLCFVLF